MNLLKKPSILLLGVTITLILVFGGGLSVWGQTSKILRVGWSITSPLVTKNEQGGLGGFDIEILETVAERAGYTLAYSQGDIPWARQLLMLRVGELDIGVSASWSQERAKWGYYTFPYRGEYLGIYMLKDKIGGYFIDKIEDIAFLDFELGALIGCFYGVRMDNTIKLLEEKIQLVSDKDQNPQKLIYARIDGYIGYPVEEKLRLTRLKMDKQILLHPKTLIKTGGVHFLISRKSQTYETLIDLNHALETIKADGTYDRIVDNYRKTYGIQNWAP